MELQPHVDSIHHQLVAAAEASGEDARALAQRLAAPLDAAIRLTLQDALALAAEEITRDLAPGSVELRLRGGEPEFVVSAPPADDLAHTDADAALNSWQAIGVAGPEVDPGEGAGMARINLRMPERLKAQVEHAAGAEGLSVNAWLVRAAGAAAQQSAPDQRRKQRSQKGTNRYRGWAR